MRLISPRRTLTAICSVPLLAGCGGGADGGDQAVAAPVQEAAPAPAFTYDAQGRLIGIAYPSGASVTYEYDSEGNLANKVVTPPPLGLAAAQQTD